MVSQEKKNGRRFLTWRDAVILVVVLIVAIIWYWRVNQVPADVAVVAIVIINDVEVDRIELISGAERDFQYAECPAVILHRYENGNVAFIQSDCPDQVCVNEGKLFAPYQFAACLPNHVIVTLEATAGASTDPSDLGVDIAY